MKISTEEKVRLSQQYLEQASNMCYSYLSENFISNISIAEILQKVSRVKELLEDITPEEPKLLLEAADAAHGLRGHIVSDGGCRTPGGIR